MIVSINQPAYLPWLGYYYRIAKSDIFIYLDHVQFEKNSMTNRNKIKTSNGAVMLTVPVKTSGKFGDLKIAELEIDPAQKWAKKHLSSIQQAYSKAPYFKEIFPSLEAIYAKPFTHLNEVLKEMNNFLLSYLEINTKVLYSSEMKAEGAKSELVLNLCKEVGATTYLSGPFGRDYLDLPSFEQAGIKVEYADYQHPEYPQLHGAFEPYLTVFDVLFNHGKKSLEIILSNQNESISK
ncbi:MAG: WbqC family protein [Bacteroidetes bacterium]|nr:WbqC family protein [Bacteroidota bacterium]